MAPERRNKTAQSVLNGIAIIMVLAGLFLIFRGNSSDDRLIGSVNVLLGSSLVAWERWR
jgi:hypothetical protein